MFEIYMNVAVKRGKFMDIKPIGINNHQKTNFGWITDRAKAQLIPLINQKNTRIYKDARRKFNDLDKYEYSILDYNNGTYTLYSAEYISIVPVKTKNNIYSIMNNLFKDAINLLQTSIRYANKRERFLTLEDFNNK